MEMITMPNIEAPNATGVQQGFCWSTYLDLILWSKQSGQKQGNGCLSVLSLSVFNISVKC